MTPFTPGEAVKLAEQLIELAAKATPGPYSAQAMEKLLRAAIGTDIGSIDAVLALRGDQIKHDAAYFAAAHPAAVTALARYVLSRPREERTPGTVEVCSYCGAHETGDAWELSEHDAIPWAECPQPRCPMRPTAAAPVPQGDIGEVFDSALMRSARIVEPAVPQGVETHHPCCNKWDEHGTFLVPTRDCTCPAPPTSPALEGVTLTGLEQATVDHVRANYAASSPGMKLVHTIDRLTAHEGG